VKVHSELQLKLRDQMKTDHPAPDEFKTKVASILKSDDAYIPASAIFFDDLESKSTRQEDLGVLNDEGRATLAKMREDCQIHPEADQSSGDWALNQKNSATAVKWIDGSKCPIAYRNNLVFEATLASADGDLGTGCAVVSITETTEVKDSKLAAKAGQMKKWIG